MPKRVRFRVGMAHHVRFLVRVSGGRREAIGEVSSAAVQIEALQVVTGWGSTYQNTARKWQKEPPITNTCQMA